MSKVVETVAFKPRHLKQATAEPSAKRASAPDTRPVSPGSSPWPTTSKPASKPASSATTPTWPAPTASPGPGSPR